VVLLPQAQRLEFGHLSRHAEIISKHSPFLEADLQSLIHGAGRDALSQLAEANHALLIAEQARADRARAGLLLGMLLLIVALALVVKRYFDSLHQRAKDLALAGTVFQSSQQGIIVTDRGATSSGSIRPIAGLPASAKRNCSARIRASSNQACRKPGFTANVARSAGQGQLAGRNQESPQEWRVLRAMGEYRRGQRRSGRKTVCRHRFRYIRTGRYARAARQSGLLRYVDRLPNRVLFQDRCARR
jgi:hypothetical protein